jgi:hypothetical protein
MRINLVKILGVVAQRQDLVILELARMRRGLFFRLLFLDDLRDIGALIFAILKRVIDEVLERRETVKLLRFTHTVMKNIHFLNLIDKT